MYSPRASTAALVAVLTLVATGCTAGKDTPAPSTPTSTAATYVDAPDLPVPTGQPVSQVVLDKDYVGYIHGVGDSPQYNAVSIRTRAGGYPVAYEREGHYKGGGIYSLGIAAGWAVWTETSKIVTTDNGDVEWSVVAVNLTSKAERVIATSIAPTLAPRAVIGNGVIAFAVRPQDRTRATPGSRPDPIEYVRLDSIETLHTLMSRVQYDPLTVGLSDKGVLLAILEEGQQGIDELGFDSTQRPLYRGNVVVSTIGYGRFGSTDQPVEGVDGSAGAPMNLNVCTLVCVTPTQIVKGTGVSEQHLGRSIVTFSGQRDADVETGHSGDVTVLTLTGESVDNLKVGGLVYAGWSIYEDAVCWVSPSSAKPSERAERIHVRTYTVTK